MPYFHESEDKYNLDPRDHRDDTKGLKLEGNVDYRHPLIDNKKEDLRRNLKWLSFTKPKVISGFDHLSPSELPAMSAKARGISLSFCKIVGWRVPINQLFSVNEEDDEFTLQLSFSLYHFHSKSFFGSTWMGTSLSLTDGANLLPVIIDIDYNDIIYLISRLTDPSCVGVVEIVISKVDKKRKVISSQYGYVCIYYYYYYINYNCYGILIMSCTKLWLVNDKNI